MDSLRGKFARWWDIYRRDRAWQMARLLHETPEPNNNEVDTGGWCLVQPTGWLPHTKFPQWPVLLSQGGQAGRQQEEKTETGSAGG